jgi:signal transduction histidine kinase
MGSAIPIRYDGDLNIDLPRFTRILCNFVKNSREAMPNGGILTLTTEPDQNEICEFPIPALVSHPMSCPDCSNHSSPTARRMAPAWVWPLPSRSWKRTKAKFPYRVYKAVGPPWKSDCRSLL